MDYYFSAEGDGKTVGQSHTNYMPDASLFPYPHKKTRNYFCPMQLTLRLDVFL